MIRMPGKSHSGPLPPLSPGEAEIAASVRQDVQELAGRIGIRTAFDRGLEAAADYVESRFKESKYSVSRQVFEVEKKPCANLEVEIPGSSAPGEIVVVGAHYDSVIGCPGANDNATGVAGVLAIAAALAGSKPERTLRFLAFANEEPPFFQTDGMGSRVYARRCRERKENVVAMVSLETIGYYSDAPGSQKYPPPFGFFYPDRGDFITFVGNLSSRALVRRALGAFREGAKFPSEGGALPSFIAGIGWSDHWAFWQEGYKAIMVTDTAPFRYPHYHLPGDKPDRIDADRCARVVAGLEKVVRDLVGAVTAPVFP
jgi:Zn-dependent M28 family amino/carboxypeptidase